MGAYRDQLLPRMIDIGCKPGRTRAERRGVCAGLAGGAVEIGFGSGPTVPFYPAGVTRVGAGEPADTAWLLAGKRFREAPIPVERAGLDGRALPFPDARFDA